MRDAEHPSEASRNAFVEGRASAEEHAAILRHRAGCRRCAAELEALAAVRVVLAVEAERDAVPDAAFEARLRGALDREDAARAKRRPDTAGSRRVAWAGLAAAAALALLWIGLAGDVASNGPVDAAFADASAAGIDRLVIDLATTDPAALAAFHRDQGVAFPSRVLDLGMMGWTLAGGSVGAVAGRASALALYRDASGRWLVCRMFEGDAASLPPPAERFEASGFTFYVHRRDRATAVFWQEGGVLCVLVSDSPEADVRALAVAKAMLPG
jgi:anti-sigma factor RsiW